VKLQIGGNIIKRKKLMLAQDKPQSREKIRNLKFMTIHSSTAVQPFAGSWPFIQFRNPIHSW
jgi:hypothetical protein